MIFYHGSKLIIDSIKQYGSNPRNDYGPSFYLTDNYINAKLWACKNDSVGYTNKYYIRKDVFESLKILDLTKTEKYSVLNWIAILMHFRDVGNHFKNIYKESLEWLEKYYIDVTQYDVVIGYRADDAYFKFPLQFLSNALSLEDLQEVFRIGNLGKQYAFMSERAINSLKYIDSKKCDESFIGRYHSIVEKATEEYISVSSKPIEISKTYLRDIIKYEEK